MCYVRLQQGSPWEPNPEWTGDGYRESPRQWSDWNSRDTAPRWQQTNTQPSEDLYGLSQRPDLPQAWDQSSRSDAASRTSFNNYDVYDPLTKLPTRADRNCTAPGCCVPKCFAEKGVRVSFFNFYG